MSFDRRVFVTGTLGLGLAAFLPVGGYALAMAAGQVAHRILAAEKLSFLTEKVAKATVLLSLGAEADKALTELQQAHDEFDDILLGFKEGKGSSGIDRERFYSVNKALEEVATLWAPYRIAVEDIIATKSVNDAQLTMIVGDVEPLEEANHGVVRKLEAAYGEVDIEPSMALALEFAGRQRMITQKICKEIALAATGKDTAEHQEKFKKNAAKFGKIVDALIDGGNDYIKMSTPPSDASLAALKQVKAYWAELQPTVEALNAADVPSLDDVVHFCAEMDVLENESERAVLLYEDAIKIGS